MSRNKDRTENPITRSVASKSEHLSVSSECGDDGTILENENDAVRSYFKWSPESTKLLLSLRLHQDSAFSNRKAKKKQLWDHIAKGMYRIAGFQLSGVLCSLKFRNMMQTYKKNREKEINGNSDLIVWEYYKHFKDAFGHKFIGSRTTNFAESLLYEDTMMETPNRSIDPPNDLNETSTNIEMERADQEADDDTREFEPLVSNTNKGNGRNYDEDTAEPTLTDDERNDCIAFGNSISCQLQNIKHSHSRALVKLKMQKILYLAQTGQLALNNNRL